MPANDVSLPLKGGRLGGMDMHVHISSKTPQKKKWVTDTPERRIDITKNGTMRVSHHRVLVPQLRLGLDSLVGSSDVV